MSAVPSRRSLRGYAAAALLLAAVAGVSVWFYRSRTVSDSAPLTAEESAALDSFNRAVDADSIARREAWERRYPDYRQQGYRKGKDGYQSRPVETFAFDPNHCDSLTFLRLGLRPWQAHNALQYRRKGGVWRSAEHFSKLYGLDAEDYQRLAPYIRIESSVASAPRHDAAHPATPTRQYPEKYTPGSVTLDLNECDTSQLRCIPEIGSYRARHIVQYRQQLGGFVSTSQLSEIQGLPPGISSWFTIDKDLEPEKLNLNSATFQQLARHPYISYEQAREVMNYRKRYGKLKSIEDLRLSPHFSSSDFQRLRPYLEF